jgi:nucleoside-diphosphate-sugar epimerase
MPDTIVLVVQQLLERGNPPGAGFLYGQVHGVDHHPIPQDDPRFRKWNLWSYIDARDAAQAIRRALEAPFKGADVFVIANSDTVMSRPTTELLAEIFPSVPLKKHLGPNETLLSIDKARRVLGYEPQYSWRDPASSVR